jgi:hypothetical protein
LDALAAQYNFKRPERFSFKPSEIFNKVNELKGIEGFCIYTNKGIWKVKNEQYLLLHKMKSELNSFDKLVDVYFSQCFNYDYEQFYNFIHNTFDYEIAQQCKHNIFKITEKMEDVKEIFMIMKSFVEEVKKLPNRKEMAQKIIGFYQPVNRSSFAFKLLDGKELDSDDYKKLLHQIL